MKRNLLLPLLLLATLFPLFCQENVFVISTSYRNLLSNDDRTGMLDLVMKEAFRRIGMKAEIVFTPTEKSIVDANAGIVDGELNRIAGMEEMYPDLVRVPEPNMTMRFVAFSKRQIPIDGWESIRELDIGIVKGWKILETATEGFPQVVYVPTETELFNMLRKDRIDLALYSELTGYAVLKDMGLQGITHLEPPLAERDMYLYVHKEHAALTSAIAGALKSMKDDGTYAALVEETTQPYRETR